MTLALSTRRRALMNEATWWLRNAGSIHYAQTRPMPLTQSAAHRLPLTTDCSGAVTCLYHAVLAQDPNQLGYNGQGFTGTLFTNGEPIDIDKAEPGDLVIVGKGDASVHVYMVMEHDVWFSHGREEAPETVTKANAIASHGRDNLFGRQYLLPSADQQPHWVVVNGRGDRIGRTKHPKLWVARKPGMIFRDYGRITFVRKER